jgi:hypothetical protein
MLPCGYQLPIIANHQWEALQLQHGERRTANGEDEDSSDNRQASSTSI